MAVRPVRHKFTVEEYHRMAEAGILSEDDRVELIEGEIVEMAPIGSRHAGTVDFLADFFFRHVGEGVLVRVQNPIRLGKHSEPQPDLVLLKRQDDFYRSRHPGPDDVLLVVEVAETSAKDDRAVKVPLYGRHGVPEVWLVDLSAEVVEVYREPSSAGYRQVRRAGRGEVLTPLRVPAVTVPVEAILGPEA